MNIGLSHIFPVKLRERHDAKRHWIDVETNFISGVFERNEMSKCLFLGIHLPNLNGGGRGKKGKRIDDFRFSVWFEGTERESSSYWFSLISLSLFSLFWFCPICHKYRLVSGLTNLKQTNDDKKKLLLSYRRAKKKFPFLFFSLEQRSAERT